MKRILSAAIATVSVVTLVASGTAAVSAHNNNGGWKNNRWGSHQHDKQFSDIRVIDYAVKHSELAIDLSKVAVEKGTQAELKTSAQATIDTETQHVADLKALRQQIIDDKQDDSNDQNKDQDVSSLYKMDSRHSSDSMHSFGWGLMTADELSASANVDQDYIDVMIKHHTFTLLAGDKVLDKVDNADLKKMVRTMMNEQGTHIGQLSTWRAAWYPDDIDSNV
jgi:uncharacterized protein (DUF305 family)